jgi:alkaline phosphatase
MRDEGWAEVFANGRRQSEMTKNSNHIRLGRRVFLKQGALVLTAASLSSSQVFAAEAAPRLRIGLVTDLHYADKAPAGTRHYRETLAKLEEAARQFEQDKPSFLVELGDFMDAADSVDVEQTYLKKINREFSAICKDRHYVLGNHAEERGILGWCRAREVVLFI